MNNTAIRKFKKVIENTNVFIKLKCCERDEALRELVEALVITGRINRLDDESVLRAIIKREQEASTGIGKGIACPHVRLSCLTQLIAAIGRSAKGINFGSLDKQPVYTIFLILGPDFLCEEVTLVMEGLFTVATSSMFRNKIRYCTGINEFYSLIGELEST